MEKKLKLNINSYVKETHILIGSKDEFSKALDKMGVFKAKENTISFKGFKVIENSFVPQNKAILVDKNGDILQVFTL